MDSNLPSTNSPPAFPQAIINFTRQQEQQARPAPDEQQPEDELNVFERDEARTQPAEPESEGKQSRLPSPPTENKRPPLRVGELRMEMQQLQEQCEMLTARITSNVLSLRPATFQSMSQRGPSNQPSNEKGLPQEKQQNRKESGSDFRLPPLPLTSGEPSKVAPNSTRNLRAMTSLKEWHFPRNEPSAEEEKEGEAKEEWSPEDSQYEILQSKIESKYKQLTSSKTLADQQPNGRATAPLVKRKIPKVPPLQLPQGGMSTDSAESRRDLINKIRQENEQLKKRIAHKIKKKNALKTAGSSNFKQEIRNVLGSQISGMEDLLQDSQPSSFTKNFLEGDLPKEVATPVPEPEVVPPEKQRSLEKKPAPKQEESHRRESPKPPLRNIAGVKPVESQAPSSKMLDKAIQLLEGQTDSQQELTKLLKSIADLLHPIKKQEEGSFLKGVEVVKHEISQTISMITANKSSEKSLKTKLEGVTQQAESSKTKWEKQLEEASLEISKKTKEIDELQRQIDNLSTALAKSQSKGDIQVKEIKALQEKLKKNRKPLVSQAACQTVKPGTQDKQVQVSEESEESEIDKEMLTVIGEDFREDDEESSYGGILKKSFKASVLSLNKEPSDSRPSHAQAHKQRRYSTGNTLPSASQGIRRSSRRKSAITQGGYRLYGSPGFIGQVQADKVGEIEILADFKSYRRRTKVAVKREEVKKEESDKKKNSPARDSVKEKTDRQVSTKIVIEPEPAPMLPKGSFASFSNDDSKLRGSSFGRGSRKRSLKKEIGQPVIKEESPSMMGTPMTTNEPKKLKNQIKEDISPIRRPEPGSRIAASIPQQPSAEPNLAQSIMQKMDAIPDSTAFRKAAKDISYDEIDVSRIEKKSSEASAEFSRQMGMLEGQSKLSQKGVTEEEGALFQLKLSVQQETQPAKLNLTTNEQKSPVLTEPKLVNFGAVSSAVPKIEEAKLEPKAEPKTKAEMKATILYEPSSASSMSPRNLRASFGNRQNFKIGNLNAKEESPVKHERGQPKKPMMVKEEEKEPPRATSGSPEKFLSPDKQSNSSPGKSSPRKSGSPGKSPRKSSKPRKSCSSRKKRGSGEEEKNGSEDSCSSSNTEDWEQANEGYNEENKEKLNDAIKKLFGMNGKPKQNFLSIKQLQNIRLTVPAMGGSARLGDDLPPSARRMSVAMRRNSKAIDVFCKNEIEQRKKKMAALRGQFKNQLQTQIDSRRSSKAMLREQLRAKMEQYSPSRPAATE